MPSPYAQLTRRRPARAASFGARGAVALATAALAACGGGVDPYAPRAQYPTVATTFTVYPRGAAPAAQFTALDLRAPLAVRPALQVVSQGNAGVLYPNFDGAFDLDATGRVVLLPPKLITAAQVIPRTGFQVVKSVYDSLGTAPGGNYQADSALTVTPGQTIVIQAQGTACPVSSPFYAKLVVDSVSSATRAIYLRTRIDPNCGFRSFAAGLPTS